MEHVSRAAHDGDVTAFVSTLQREQWLLGEACVEFQARLIATATLNDRREIIAALLNLDPALLRRQPPPQSQAVEFAFTYATTHLIPLLTRIWPVPDDLPHAAGMGDLSRVKQWFDESGAPTLGGVENHYPSSPYMPKHRVEEYAGQWGAPSEQVREVQKALHDRNYYDGPIDGLLTPDALRTARVRAKTPVRCLAISRGDFRKILTDEPKVAIQVLETVATRLASPL